MSRVTILKAHNTYNIKGARHISRVNFSQIWWASFLALSPTCGRFVIVYGSIAVILVESTLSHERLEWHFSRYHRLVHCFWLSLPYHSFNMFGKLVNISVLSSNYPGKAFTIIRHFIVTSYDIFDESVEFGCSNVNRYFVYFYSGYFRFTAPCESTFYSRLN